MEYGEVKVVCEYAFQLVHMDSDDIDVEIVLISFANERNLSQRYEGRNQFIK